MNEQNIPTAPEQSAPPQHPKRPRRVRPAEEAVTVGALRGAIERKAAAAGAPRGRGIRRALVARGGRAGGAVPGL